MNITYQEIKPSAALQDYVDCYWLQSFTGAVGNELSPTQRCPPFGMVEIIVHIDDNCSEVCFNGKWEKLPRIFLAGLYRDPVLWRSSANTRKFGVRMKPETFHLFFKAHAATLYSDYTAMENIMGKEAIQFAEQVSEAGDLRSVIARTEAFLMTQLRKTRLESNYMMEAAKLIRSAQGDITIEEVSKSVFVSMRQLQRSFRDSIGTSPKTYLRIIRFRNAYRGMQKLEETGGWTGLTYDLGYSDQAHFIREFKEFSGLIPNLMRLNKGQVFGSAEPQLL